MAQGVIWYDASTIIGNVGDTVTNVANSGSVSWGGALSVPVSAAGPTIAIVDGLQMLKFTQNSPNFQRLVSTGFGGNVLSGNRTYFLVAQYDISGTDKGRIFSSTRDGVSDNWLLGHNTARSCIAYTAAMPVSTFINGVEASSSYATSPYQSGRYVYCLTQATDGVGNVTSTMYVNGIFKGTLTATAAQAQTPTNFSIGGCGTLNTNGEMSDCYFCEARVYNYVLPQSTRGIITDDLVTIWKVNTLAPPTALTPSGTVTIDPRVYDSTITINASQITSNLSLVGVTGVDPTKPVIISSLSASYPSPSVGLKSVTVTGTVSDPANYTLSIPPVSTFINAAPLTISFTVQNKEYDGTPAAEAAVGVISGFVGNETGTVTITSANFSSSAFGTNKAVAVTATASDPVFGNYSITYVQPTADITAAPLTVSGVTANNKVFDGTPVATTTGTPILTGVVTGETVTASVSSANFNDSTVDTEKPVTVAFTLSGATSSNYTLANITLYADITAVPTPTQAQQYLVSSTTDTSASGVTSCVGTTSMRQSKAQGTFKPATSQDWIRYKKGLCSR